MSYMRVKTFENVLPFKAFWAAACSAAFLFDPSPTYLHVI
jgi:hypothetical protein